MRLMRADYDEMQRLFLRSLSRSEKMTLKKLCPFRLDRNNLIGRLYRRGVPQSLLARVSGISPVQIWRIVKQHRGRKGAR